MNHLPTALIGLSLLITPAASAEEPPGKPAASHTIEAVRKLIGEGHYAEAEQLGRELLAEQSAAHGKDSIEAATVLDSLVGALWRGGKGASPETRAFAERAVAIKTKVYGPAHLETAISLNGLALCAYFSNDLPEAIALIRRVLEIRERELGPQHLDVASMAENLGIFLWRTGDLDEARRLFLRTLTIREARLAPDDALINQTLVNLAALEQEAGNYPRSLELYERALKIAEKTLPPGHPQFALTLSNMASLQGELGRLEDARTSLERALAIREQALGPKHPDVAETLSALGFLHAGRLLDPAGGLPLLQRSLSIFEEVEGPEHRQVGTTLQNLAIAYQLAGDYPRAISAFERGCAIQERSLGTNNPQVSGCIDDYADLLLSIGDYQGARVRRERALEIRKQALGAENPLVARTMMNLGMVLSRTGDLAGARSLEEQALRLLEKLMGPNDAQVAMALENLGELDEMERRLPDARSAYERALRIREAAYGSDSVALTAALVPLARVVGALGETTVAEKSYKRALAIQEKNLGADHPWTAATLAGYADLLAGAGAIAPALDAALMAERVGIDHLRLTTRGISERAALSYAGVREGALDLALSLVGSQEKHSADSVRRVWDAVIRSRAAVLDEIAFRHSLAVTRDDPEIGELLEDTTRTRTRLANLLVRGPGDDDPNRYRATIDAARNEMDRAESALAGKSSAFGENLARGRVGFDAIARSLPSDAALVAYVTYAHRPDAASFAALVLRGGSTEAAFVPLGPSAEIDSLVSLWQEEAARGATSPGTTAAESINFYRRAGNDLRNRIWDPIAPRLSSVHRVFIVPEGSLNLVSFAALPVGRSSYLLEKGPLIHYLSAERDLVPRERSASSAAGLLALGGPDYEERALFASLRKDAPSPLPGTPVSIASAQVFRGERSACGQFESVKFRPLPETAREADDIAALWTGASDSAGPAQVLTGSRASEAAFKTQAPGHRVLHIATHGFFLGGRCASALEPRRGVTGLIGPEPSPSKPTAAPPATPQPVTAAFNPGDNPLVLSGVALAGANHRAAAGPDEDDGVLTAEEIGAMDLSGVEWAVLSACDTGVGQIRAGEGVFGLRRSFETAGARTLIMSLWSVEDESARRWMKALYQARFREHRDTAEAVRKASLTVLQERRSRGESIHPFYWAGFVAAGDWR